MAVVVAAAAGEEEEWLAERAYFLDVVAFRLVVHSSTRLVLSVYRVPRLEMGHLHNQVHAVSTNQRRPCGSSHNV